MSVCDDFAVLRGNSLNVYGHDIRVSPRCTSGARAMCWRLEPDGEQPNPPLHPSRGCRRRNEPVTRDSVGSPHSVQVSEKTGTSWDSPTRSKDTIVETLTADVTCLTSDFTITMTEVPFTISVSDAKLDLLRRKLELSTFPDELEDAAWKYGAPLADIQRLVERWKDGYDWRKHEKELNDELPMFTRDIDVDNFGTLNIHYVHKKSIATNAIPLLYCHGCMYCLSLTCVPRLLIEHLGPGTFHEARKLLPLLTASSPDHPSFHVVALSLPGYGFSEAPRKQGFAIKQYAEVCSLLYIVCSIAHFY